MACIDDVQFTSAKTYIMKAIAILYSIVMVVFASITFMLSLESSYRMDNAIVISNWLTLICFPLTFYFLRQYFFRHQSGDIIIVLFLINSFIFYSCCNNLIKNSDDGLRELAPTLVIPALGFLLSLFFVLKFSMIKLSSIGAKGG